MQHMDYEKAKKNLFDHMKKLNDGCSGMKEIDVDTAQKIWSTFNKVFGDPLKKVFFIKKSYGNAKGYFTYNVCYGVPPEDWADPIGFYICENLYKRIIRYGLQEAVEKIKEETKHDQSVHI